MNSISASTKQADNCILSCIERKLYFSITTLLDGFVVMRSNNPDVSYKLKVCMFYIATHMQVYMRKYTPGSTFDVWVPYKCQVLFSSWGKVHRNKIKGIVYCFKRCQLLSEFTAGITNLCEPSTNKCLCRLVAGGKIA